MVGSLLLAAQVQAAGPWKGQVIDGQTKKPIEGAVILLVWYKVVGLMDANYQYYHSEEVVTDVQGRFQIPSKWTLNIFVQINRPEIYIFKGGYGKWQIQDYGEYRREKYESDTEQNAARLTGQGAVLELPRLKTRQERVSFQSGLPPRHVPDAQIPKFLEVYNTERRALDLPPAHVLPKEGGKR